MNTEIIAAMRTDIGILFHLIYKYSGLAGIAYWMNEHYGLCGEEKMSKDTPLVVTLKEWVDEMYADGRTTSLSNQELEDKIKELTEAEK